MRLRMKPIAQIFVSTSSDENLSPPTQIIIKTKYEDKFGQQEE